jgi:hypothetical protein
MPKGGARLAPSAADKPFSARSQKQTQKKEKDGYDWHSGSDNEEDKRARHDKSGSSDPRNAQTRRRKARNDFTSQAKSHAIEYLKALFDDTVEYNEESDDEFEGEEDETFAERERGRFGHLDVHLKIVNGGKHSNRVQVERVPFAHSGAGDRANARQSRGSRGKGKQKGAHVDDAEELWALQVTLPAEAVSLEVEDLAPETRRETRFVLLFRTSELAGENPHDNGYFDSSRGGKNAERDVAVQSFEIAYTSPDHWEVVRLDEPSGEAADEVLTSNDREEQKRQRKMSGSARAGGREFEPSQCL